MKEGTCFHRDSNELCDIHIHIDTYIPNTYAAALYIPFRCSNAIEILLFSSHTHRYMPPNRILNTLSVIWKQVLASEFCAKLYHKLCLLLREFSIAPHSLHTHAQVTQHMAAYLTIKQWPWLYNVPHISPYTIYYFNFGKTSSIILLACSYSPDSTHGLTHTYIRVQQSRKE